MLHNPLVPRLLFNHPWVARNVQFAQVHASIIFLYIRIYAMYYGIVWLFCASNAYRLHVPLRVTWGKRWVIHTSIRVSVALRETLLYVPQLVQTLFMRCWKTCRFLLFIVSIFHYQNVSMLIFSGYKHSRWTALHFFSWTDLEWHFALRNCEKKNFNQQK